MPVAVKRASMVAVSSHGTGSSDGVASSMRDPARDADANDACSMPVGDGSVAAAEQAGVGDVLHAGDRATEGGGVVASLGHGGPDRVGAHVRPARVVVVDPPAGAVDAEIGLAGQGRFDPGQHVEIAGR